MIQQVWMNLISNAVKFTHDRENAIVEIGYQLGQNEHIFFVKDNGIGFDMRQAAKLFDVFQQLHSPAQYEGAGAGLAIVERIIHRHGGRVWAEAVVDQGAAFYFALPVFLSIVPENQFAMRVMKAGSDGYLTKGGVSEELAHEARKLAAGKKYMSPELVGKPVTTTGIETERLRHEKLSEREYQVLRNLAAGKSLSRIAEESYLSVKTVATYRARVLAKMNMRTTAELIHYAIEHKLIDSSSQSQISLPTLPLP